MFICATCSMNTFTLLNRSICVYLHSSFGFSLAFDFWSRSKDCEWPVTVFSGAYYFSGAYFLRNTSKFSISRSKDVYASTLSCLNCGYLITVRYWLELVVHCIIELPVLCFLLAAKYPLRSHCSRLWSLLCSE